MMKKQRDWLLVYYFLANHSKYEIPHCEPEKHGNVNNSNFNPSFFNFLIYEMSGSQTYRLHGSVKVFKGAGTKQQRVADIILPSINIKNNKQIKTYHLLVPSFH